MTQIDSSSLDNPANTRLLLINLIIMSYSDIQDYEKLLKLVIIGDGSVGKSCLIKQFVEGTFYENGATTVGR